MTISTTFGGRVRYLRGDLSQSQFAMLLGTSKQNISKYEHDISFPEISVLIAFHEKLNVSLDWLLMGKGNVYYVESGKEQSMLQELKKENMELKFMVQDICISINKSVEDFKKNYETKTNSN